MELTPDEKKRLGDVAKKLERLQGFMASRSLKTESVDPSYWLGHLTEIKRILGNFNNDTSYVATLLAKDFLTVRHGIRTFRSTLKLPGAAGFDMSETTPEGKHVIAEIKTTLPCEGSNLGAQQKKSVEKDLARLNKAVADYKYFFVVERQAFEYVERNYLQTLEGVSIVLLPDALFDKSFAIEAVSALGNPRIGALSGKGQQPRTGMPIDGESRQPDLASDFMREIPQRPEARELPTGRKAPTAVEFQRELDRLLTEASNAGRGSIDISSKDLHRRVWGYPRPTPRMPMCCGVMRKNMTSKDSILEKPPKGNGAGLKIRYRLPRS